MSYNQGLLRPRLGLLTRMKSFQLRQLELQLQPEKEQSMQAML